MNSNKIWPETRGKKKKKAKTQTRVSNSTQSKRGLSPTICDYKQLISIGYNYNQFEINDVS